MNNVCNAYIKLSVKFLKEDFIQYFILNWMKIKDVIIILILMLEFSQSVISTQLYTLGSYTVYK